MSHSFAFQSGTGAAFLIQPGGWGVMRQELGISGSAEQRGLSQPRPQKQTGGGKLSGHTAGTEQRHRTSKRDACGSLKALQRFIQPHFCTIFLRNTPGSGTSRLQPTDGHPLVRPPRGLQAPQARGLQGEARRAPPGPAPALKPR